VTLFFSELVNGLSLAAFFALVSAGLALIFGVVGIVNFAHGDFVMVAGYLFYESYTQMHLPYLLAIVVTVLAASIVAGAVYLIAIAHLINRPWHTQLLATLAISILLENIAQKIWSPSARSVATPATLHVVHLGSDISITWQELYVWIGSIACLLVMWFFIVRTRWGKAMRAVSQNREACAVIGIRVKSVALLAFVISIALCAVAATLVLPMQNVYPTAGLTITTQAFVVVILGGMGSIRGALVASVIIGLVQAFAAGYISSAYTDAFGYAVMIAILVFHPNGLFGDRSLRGWAGL
jgi:branched-chain amino acid transport system permease protein